jgi:hypothetical protein
MSIEDALLIASQFTNHEITEFEIPIEMFNNENGRELYNQKIRENVEQKCGVYIWYSNETEEIIYIGMAGTIKTDGSFGEHNLQNRLTASRGKDKLTKKDVLTNDYVKHNMQNMNLTNLRFYIIYTLQDEPPAYVESFLIYKYYKINQRLPILNNSY